MADPHGIGWTLHQLRHSALGHLAASGHSAPELQAKSRHQHLATHGHYVRLGEETSARITAEHDTHNHRRNHWTCPLATLRLVARTRADGLIVWVMWWTRLWISSVSSRMGRASNRRV